MTGKRYAWTIMVLFMVAAMCGTVSAATGIVAETHPVSAGEYLTCTPPCECISEATAALRWGAAGYERCSKTICGQTSDASVQYYCIHQVGSTAAAPTTAQTATAPPAVVITAAPVTTGTAPSATVPQKTPVDPALVFAAVALALPAAARAGRK